jgi:hypothetical protein
MSARSRYCFKVSKQGVELSQVYKSLQTFMGGLFETISIVSAGSGRLMSRPRGIVGPMLRI